MIEVDKIVTISLTADIERQEQTKKELEKLQLKTDFFLTERDIENRERGCFQSHVHVARNALHTNIKSLLVFEDDVKILPFTQKQIGAINHFLKTNKTKFDALYLGLIVGKMWISGNFFTVRYPIVRAKGAGSQAYILSREGMEKLSRYEYTGTAIDKLIKHDFKCYSIYPIIANQYSKYQSPSKTYSQALLDERIADDLFWKNNLKKQKGMLCKNLHKTLSEMIGLGK